MALRSQLQRNGRWKTESGGNRPGGLWDRLGEIMEVCGSQGVGVRSAYVRDLVSGCSYLRNQIFLKSNNVDNECEDNVQDEEEADMAVVIQKLAVRVKSAMRSQPGGRQAERQLGQPARGVRFRLPGGQVVRCGQDSEEQWEERGE